MHPRVRWDDEIQIRMDPRVRGDDEACLSFPRLRGKVPEADGGWSRMTTKGFRLRRARHDE